MFLPHMPDNVAVFGIFVSIVGTILIINWMGITRIRHFVIHFTQFCAIFSLSLSAVIGASFGFTMGRTIVSSFRETPSPGPDLVISVLAAPVGAFLFFAIAAIPFSLLFLLTDISINTRHLRIAQLHRTEPEVKPIANLKTPPRKSIATADQVAVAILLGAALVVLAVIAISVLPK